MERASFTAIPGRWLLAGVRSRPHAILSPHALLSKRILAAISGLACGLVLLAAQASTTDAQTSSTNQSGNTSAPVATATLAQCITATEQAERSATFSGEMTMVAGAERMAMRIEVLERMPNETLYHSIEAPGLGIWRSSDPGVKTYKDLERITNLTAPAHYRAEVRFRWLNADGHVVKHIELHTHRCVQPAPPAPESTSTTPASTPTSTTPASTPATTG
jgi:hypothetical protein